MAATTESARVRLDPSHDPLRGEGEVDVVTLTPEQAVVAREVLNRPAPPWAADDIFRPR